MPPNDEMNDTSRKEPAALKPSTKKKSSKGCLTCKLRKKRCDEIKPVCGDCQRLKLRCEYVTEEMKSAEIEKLKEEMKVVVTTSKSRIRRVKSEKDNVVSKTQAGKEKKMNEKSLKRSKIKQWKKIRESKQNEHKIVFNPLGIPQTPGFEGFPDSPGLGFAVNTYLRDEDKLAAQDEVRSHFEPNQVDRSSAANKAATSANSSNRQANMIQYPNLLSPSFDFMSLLPPPSNQDINAISTHDMSYHIPVHGTTTTTNTNLDGYNLTHPPNHQDPYPVLNSLLPASAMQLNVPQTSPHEFTDLFSTGFQKLLQDHFRSENLPFKDQSHSEVLNNARNLPTDLSDAFRFSPGILPEHEPGKIQTPPTSFLDEQFCLPNNQQQDNKGKLFDINEYTDSLRCHQSLQIYSNPSIVSNSTLSTISPFGRRLYEYYRDKLSFVVCSAPKSENMYLNTFLPMAHVDKSVLYGILAWSAFHLGGEKMEKQGNYYIKLALKGFEKRPILSEEETGKTTLLYDEVDDNDEEIVKEEEDMELESPDHVYEEDLALSKLNRDNRINMRLASFLILCGVEICKGDVSKWSKYLTYGAKLINLKGGLEKFNASKDEHFLATNYAYHDITSIHVINERPLHFDIKDYEKMWTKSNELGFMDPLHGISSPVFKILAEINKLVLIVQKMSRKANRIEKNSVHDLSVNLTNNVSTSPDDHRVFGLNEEECWIDGVSSISSTDFEGNHGYVNSYGISSVHSSEDLESSETLYAGINDDIESLMHDCQNIEQALNHVKPKISPLVTKKELELQLTMFECFQITSKIHVRQSVLRINSASLEIQYLTNQLIKLLDVLLGSDVESCLCFPMFIAGMNCVRTADRVEMTNRFDSFIKRYRWKNVSRCQIVIRYIWKLNRKGETFIDWYSVVKKLGWDLSFA